jgi:hypothetical protein
MELGAGEEHSTAAQPLTDDELLVPMRGRERQMRVERSEVIEVRRRRRAIFAKS